MSSAQTDANLEKMRGGLKIISASTEEMRRSESDHAQDEASQNHFGLAGSEFTDQVRGLPERKPVVEQSFVIPRRAEDRVEAPVVEGGRSLESDLSGGMDVFRHKPEGGEEAVGVDYLSTLPEGHPLKLQASEVAAVETGHSMFEESEGEHGHEQVTGGRSEYISGLERAVDAEAVGQQSVAESGQDLQSRLDEMYDRGVNRQRQAELEEREQVEGDGQDVMKRSVVKSKGLWGLLQAVNPLAAPAEAPVSLVEERRRQMEEVRKDMAA